MNNRDRTTRRIRGVSLIEVMIAMVVLAVGLLGLAGMTALTVRTNSLSEETERASNIRQSMLDALASQNPIVRCPAQSSPSSCAVLEATGLATNNAYLPPPDNGSCGVPNILDSSGAVRSFDFYSKNDGDLFGFPAGDQGGSDRVCDLTTLPVGQFVRYYRIYDPSDPVGGTGASTTRVIIAVVLWQDRKGTWRHVKGTQTIKPL